MKGGRDGDMDRDPKDMNDKAILYLEEECPWLKLEVWRKVNHTGSQWRNMELPDGQDTGSLWAFARLCYSNRHAPNLSEVQPRFMSSFISQYVLAAVSSDPAVHVHWRIWLKKQPLPGIGLSHRKGKKERQNSNGFQSFGSEVAHGTSAQVLHKPAANGNKDTPQERAFLQHIIRNCIPGCCMVQLKIHCMNIWLRSLWRFLPTLRFCNSIKWTHEVAWAIRWFLRTQHMNNFLKEWHSNDKYKVDYK